MHRRKVRGRALLCLGLGVLLLDAMGVAASSASADTITFVSGNGQIDSLDPNVTVTDSCSGTAQQATIVFPYSGYWSDPISGSQWDGPNASHIGCNGTYQTTFTLPAGATSPSISMSELADNSANVSLNNNQPFISRNVPGQCETDYGGPPISGSTNSGFVTGVNTLTFNVDNCYPSHGENNTGLDFVATVSYVGSGGGGSTCAIDHNRQLCNTTATAVAGASSAIAVARYADLSNCNLLPQASEPGNNGRYVVGSVTIDWGDGTSSTSGTAAVGTMCNATGPLSTNEIGQEELITGTHTYRSPGTYTATVSLSYVRGSDNTYQNCTTPCVALGAPAQTTVTVTGGGGSGGGGGGGSTVTGAVAFAGCNAATQSQNVAVQGIEVIQAVQTVEQANPGHPPQTAEGCYDVPGFAGTHPGAIYPQGPLFNSDGTVNRVALVAGHKTVVRVYADTQGFGGSTPPVDARLYVYQHHGPGNDTLIGTAASNPLFPDAGPQRLSAGSLDVTWGERATPNAAYEFTLPSAWTSGTLTLVAEVNPPDGRAIAECAGCGVDDVFSLGGVSFASTRGLYIRAGALTTAGLYLPPPEAAFSALHSVLPVADAALNYPLGSYDVTVGPFNPGGACAFAGPFLENLFPWHPPFPSTPDIERALFVTPDTCTSGGTEPPVTFKPSFVTLDPVDTKSLANTGRPLTSVAHELIHGLGFPHAGIDCPQNPQGEPWPPDEMGQLDGFGLDVNSPSGSLRLNGVTVGLHHRIIVSPDPEYSSPASQLDYDLMSYCVGLAAPLPGSGQAPSGSAALYEQRTWISPRMWDQLFLQLSAGDYRLPGAQTASVRSRDRAAKAHALTADVMIGRTRHANGLAASSGRIYVNAVVGGVATQITSVRTTETSPQAGTLAPGYELVARNRSQQIVATTPMVAVTAEPDFAPPVAGLEGSIPAAGVAIVQIVHTGIVVAERSRPAHIPHLAVVAPRAGATVGCRSTTSRCTVAVHWRLIDPDHASLGVTVEYSADDGHSWQTVALGMSGHGTRLPARPFSHTTRARVRLRVTDGFDETSAVSGRFRSRGSPPSVVIVSPTMHDAIAADALAYLDAMATDDEGHLITGSRIRWLAGSKPLGTGPSISAQIPTGTNQITVIARDRLGRTTSRHMSLVVLAQPPRFLDLTESVTISSRARRVSLRVGASIPTVLTVSGHGASPLRLRVGRRGRHITIHIKPNRSVMKLTLTLSAGRQQTRAVVVVKR